MKTTSSGKATSRIRQRDIYLAQYPFSSGLECKLRPILVLSNSRYNQSQSDVLASPITSNMSNADYSIVLDGSKLEEGSLKQICRVRCDKIGSLEKSLLLHRIGRLNSESFNDVMTEIFAVMAE
jgi:mRNA interferase MazF